MDTLMPHGKKAIRPIFTLPEVTRVDACRTGAFPFAFEDWRGMDRTEHLRREVEESTHVAGIGTGGPLRTEPLVRLPAGFIMDSSSSHVLEQPVDVFAVYMDGTVCVGRAAVATSFAPILLWRRSRHERGTGTG